MRTGREALSWRFSGDRRLPTVPSSLASARGPPTDWGELVQAHYDRDVFQASHDEMPAIDIYSL